MVSLRIVQTRPFSGYTDNSISFQSGCAAASSQWSPPLGASPPASPPSWTPRLWEPPWWDTPLSGEPKITQNDLPQCLNIKIKHSWAGLCRCNFIIYLQNRVENLSLPPFVLALHDLPGEELLASSDKIKIKSLHILSNNTRHNISHLEQTLLNINFPVAVVAWSRNRFMLLSEQKKQKNWVGKDFGKSSPPPSSIAFFSYSKKFTFSTSKAYRLPSGLPSPHGPRVQRRSPSWHT